MKMPSTHQRGSASVFLLIICVLLLGAALIYRLRIGTQETQQYLRAISQYSNMWHEASAKLNEQKLVNLSLEQDLSNAIDGANTTSNKLRKDLVKISALTNTPPPRLVNQPDPRVAQLQEERDGFSAQVDNLTAAITKLDCELAETQRKLSSSEGDRNALLKDLKRMEAERAKLMHQFNDIALLREQLRKLKAEQAVSRRLEWIRHGLYGNYKGAELLHKSLASALPGAQNYDLNVELRRDGSAKTVPGPQ
jgi:chromosome segregation ATPase